MYKKIGVRVAVLLTLLLLFSGAGYIWWRDAISPVNPGDTSTKIFVIREGESVRSVATRLRNEKLIKDPIGFFLLVKIKKMDGKIQAGDFRLSQAMDVPTLLEELNHGTLDVWVTILEGWRVEEIALKLAQELSIPEREFLKYAKEGYMFPDTYLIPREASAAAVVALLSDNFDKKVTADLRSAIEVQNLTFDEGLILASLVEREGNSESDRPVIAGILLKRLKQGWPLQADAGLQYALGYQTDTKSWWKKSLFNEDKELNTPYNLYVHKGLPLAPISNPGLVSLRSVAYPEESEYWYYLHDNEGNVHFSKTLEEHNENIRNFLD